MGQLALAGKIRKKLVLFNYAGQEFGARQISTGWMVFKDSDFIGMAVDMSPYDFAYNWIVSHDNDIYSYDPYRCSVSMRRLWSLIENIDKS